MLHAIMYEKIDIPGNGEFIKIQTISRCQQNRG